jgi:beta-phosphoglucomutase-like phosphatase (HAD superfamily)
MSRPIAEIMGDARALLLDFDGPVCDLFGGRWSIDVATLARRYLESVGVELPARFAANHDPLRVLQWVGETHHKWVRPVDDLLIHGEMDAVDSAVPTAGTDAVIRQAHNVGWPIAIVSNNSEAPINHYLQAHELSDYITAVIGRPYGEPERMKPQPDIVRAAVESLGVTARSCVLVGDSSSDMTAAIAAGVVPIGYVKAPGRAAGLESAGAVALIDDMRDLLGAWVTA